MTRLRLEGQFTLPAANLRVAVITQLIYPDSERQAYETMIWSLEGDRGVRYAKTYKLEEDAREGHQKIMDCFKTGTYKIIPVRWVIEFEE